MLYPFNNGLEDGKKIVRKSGIHKNLNELESRPDPLPLRTELAVFKRHTNRCLHFLPFKLTCNKDVHISLDEFEFWSYRIIDGVNCPSVSEQKPID